MKRTFYAQFDGEEIAGKRYALGEAIDADVPGPILEILEQIGRIAANVPASITVPLVGSEKPVEDMTRAELESGALTAIAARMSEASDDQLKKAIKDQRQRAKAEAEPDEGEQGTKDPADDSMTGGGTSTDTPAYADLKDRALGTLKTAELEVVAKEEGVDLTEAKTNPDRVKAIEAKRAANAG